jgi:hypothetical protein
VRSRQQTKQFPPYLPWFVSKDVYVEMYKLVPKVYFRRFSTYFKRYGCLRCSRKRALYGANGLCLHCLGLVSDRLKICDRVLERKCKMKNDSGRSERFLQRVKSAQRLLSDLVAQQRPVPKSDRNVGLPAKPLMLMPPLNSTIKLRGSPFRR